VSAISVLYSGDRKKPGWTVFDEDEESLSEGNYIVPLFWLAMFGRKDLKAYYDKDTDNLLPWNNFVPYLAATKEKCLDNFRQNKKFLQSLAPETEKYFAEWEIVIESSKGEYISVDISEVYQMESGIKAKIKRTLAGFSSPSADAIAAIVNICGAQYVAESRALLPDEGKEIHYHLFGLYP
jgi:hypothetical protein